jgi:hypothetical protein
MANFPSLLLSVCLKDPDTVPGGLGLFRTIQRGRTHSGERLNLNAR